MHDWKRLHGNVPAPSHQASNYRLCSSKTGIILMTGNNQRWRCRRHHVLGSSVVPSAFVPGVLKDMNRLCLLTYVPNLAIWRPRFGVTHRGRVGACLRDAPQHRPPHPSRLSESVADIAAGPQSLQRAFHSRHSSATQATVIVSSFDSRFDCASQRGAPPSKPSAEKRLCYHHRWMGVHSVNIPAGWRRNRGEGGFPVAK